MLLSMNSISFVSIQKTAFPNQLLHLGWRCKTTLIDEFASMVPEMVITR